nr:nascent polypeptide-associated complex subunit alpha, muscle-specific form-like isoform X1 [Cherax quadricarinatus]
MGEEGGSRRDMCVGTSVATITDPDCLGPCEPGTSVMLEGIVWHETEGGVLVVNVTWRGKTYVGTLLDCTRHDWAPPRFCDSPTSDIESRTPKGRGKRGRAGTTTAGTPGNDLSVAETRSGKLRNANVKGRRGNVTPTFNPPPSPVKSEPGGTKRKGREPEVPETKNWKRSRASSRGTPTNGATSPGPEQPSSPQLIECPEPNCNKKYKHINGLKYHQSHAHNSVTNDDETTSTEGRAESEVEESQPSSPTPVVETPVDKSAQDVVKPSVLRYTGPPATPSPGPSEETAKGTTPLPTTQPSVIQTRVPQPNQAVYMYTGSGGVVSPQHPQVGSPALGMSPIPGSIPQIRPGLIRPEARPEMMMRVGTTGPRPPGPIPAGSPVTSSLPMTPQGTPLSSLPGNSPGLITVKQSLLESDKGKPKDLVNGLIGKDTREEDQSTREDARSPAYSDISDANDTAPVLDGDSNNKNMQDDKKPELPLGAQPYPPYGMYYPSPYGQPPPFLIPPIQPPPSTTPGKEGDNKDVKDKTGDSDKRDTLPPPSSSEYLNKIPPQYLYPSHYLYNPSYSDPFLREAQIYKEAEGKDLVQVREGDKGPTDLSRSAPGLPGTVSSVVPKDKLGVTKDKQTENHAILKEPHELKGQLPVDKRPFDEPTIAYRYPFDQRLPLQTQPQDKAGDKAMGIPKPSPPAPLSSPRVVSTPPAGSINNKDDRDKKSENKNEGVKPTMETTGPPPPPTSTAYFPSFPYSPLPYDPYRPMVPSLTMPAGYPPPHYLAPPGMVPRFPLTPAVSNTPEDLSRGGSSGAMIHPSHLYSSHKIHELQERARKSPLSSAALGMTPPSILSTPQKVGSPMANKDGSPLTPVTSTSSASGSIPSSSSSLTHGGSGSVGGGVEGRSPPTARPPTHHLHEGFSPYSLIPPQYHYTALGVGQTAVAAGAPSGLAAAPPTK